MERHESRDPRDQAIRAGLHDARILAGMVETEVRSAYRGARRDVYVETLARWVADLGGALSEAGDGTLRARFRDREIVIRFG